VTKIGLTHLSAYIHDYNVLLFKACIAYGVSAYTGLQMFSYESTWDTSLKIYCY